MPTETQWELIQADPELADFTTAIGSRPALVELINSANVVTVFVPTNDAIALVSNWAEIAADDTAFDTFVRSHLVTGQLSAEQIFAVTELTTVSGEKLAVDAVAATINGAHLVTADIPATNGLIHTVDRVLVIPEVTPATTTTATGTAPAG